MVNETSRRDVLRGTLAMAGLTMLGLPEWVIPALAQGEALVPFTEAVTFAVPVARALTGIGAEIAPAGTVTLAATCAMAGASSASAMTVSVPCLMAAPCHAARRATRGQQPAQTWQITSSKMSFIASPSILRPAR